MQAQKRANGRFLLKVRSPRRGFRVDNLLTYLPAIDYIRAAQHAERQLASEVQRLQREADYARESHKENEMLKTEVQVMHQHLRRLEPHVTHAYGHFTNQLSQAQQGSQGNAPGGISLPPLANQGPSGPPFGGAQNSAPAAAMQGVEYGGYGGR